MIKYIQEKLQIPEITAQYLWLFGFSYHKSSNQRVLYIPVSHNFLYAAHFTENGRLNS